MGEQLARIRLVRPSASLIAAALIGIAALAAWQAVPQTRGTQTERTPFALFPRQLGDWQQLGPEERLEPRIAKTLGADDYRQATLTRAGSLSSVGLFMAFYHDQSRGGVHSPEICLPSSGWEMSSLERVDMSSQFGTEEAFPLNRAVIRKGHSRMMVFYWFQQGERRVAWDIAAKFHLLVDGIRTGQTDGGIIRLTTPIGIDESDAEAEARLIDAAREVIVPLPRFMPES